MLYDLNGKSIWIAGHRGMVGSALVRRLGSENCKILTASRSDLDLTRQSFVEAWLQDNKPDVVVVAAAKVGGINANSKYPADFIYDNLMITSNIVHAAHQAGVDRLLFLGSSCIYPKFADQPISESQLLEGALEESNQWYAVAKIAGIKLCQAYRRQYGRDYISAMPTNLYGPGDNFELETSHVIPALMAKAHAAKVDNSKYLQVWGSGRPRREFLHVDDLADGLVHMLMNYTGEEHLNVGTGEDLEISELAGEICSVVGFEGEIKFDSSMPDGTPRKLLDVSKLGELGWRAGIDLRNGLESTYRWYVNHT